jgi:uncharacterized protein (TIGR02996 family)
VTVAAADPLAAAFLADIVAHPEEDAPRLIYADWLDEHGESDRAEFIRLQIELPQLLCDRHHDDTGHPACRCRFCLLRRRQDELFRGRWDAEVVPASWTESSRWPAPVYRRGFMAVMTLPCAEWLRRGPALVRAAPLETVRLSDRRPGLLGDGRAAWFGHTPARASLALGDLLPEPLMTRLPGGRNPGSTSTRAYTSHEAALDSLSAACLAWARATSPGVPPP